MLDTQVFRVPSPLQRTYGIPGPRDAVFFRNLVSLRYRQLPQYAVNVPKENAWRQLPNHCHGKKVATALFICIGPAAVPPVSMRIEVLCVQPSCWLGAVGDVESPTYRTTSGLRDYEDCPMVGSVAQTLAVRSERFLVTVVYGNNNTALVSSHLDREEGKVL